MSREGRAIRTQAGTTESFAWRTATWVTALAAAAPLLAVRYMPFHDMPEHVAAMATLSRMMFDANAHEPYVAALGSSQYIVYHAAGAFLAGLVKDAVLANQILLAGVAILWPLSLRALLRALGRDPRLALFAPLAFYDRALVFGFLPFVASVPLLFFSLAWFVRSTRAPSRGASVVLSVVAVGLFFTHLSTYVLFVGIAALWSIAWHVRAKTPPRDAVRAISLRGLALSPSAAFAILWWSTGSLAGGKAVSTANVVGTMSLARTLQALPVWTFDIWGSHFDEACAVAFWIAFGMLLANGLKHRERFDVLVCLPFAFALFAYLLTPFRVGMAGMLNVRLAPIVVLFAVVALPLRPSRATSSALVLAAAASVGSAAVAFVEGRRVASTMLGDFDGLLAHIRPGSRLAMLNFDRPSSNVHLHPYSFAGAYARVTAPRSIAGWSFTELPHWSLHYASEAAPPEHIPFWVFDGCRYDYARDGAFYDAVLVQGQRRPFDDAPGPHFEEVAHAGGFTLYEKTEGSPTSVDVDLVVCPEK